MSKRNLNFLFCLLCLFLVGCGPAKPTSPPIYPTVAPIADWHVLEGAGFQIWLPPTFLGGTSSNVDTVIPQLTEKDPNYAKIPQSLKERGTQYIVFAVDTSSNPDHVTYMLVAKENLTAQLDISGYLDLIAKNLVAQSNLFNVIQKETIPSDRYPMGRIVVELNTLESGDIKQVVYALNNGGAMWQISFTTPTEEFNARSQVFEQIARSATLPYTNEPASPAARIDPWVVAVIAVLVLGLGFFVGRWIIRKQKAAPVQAKKMVKKKRTKK
jgi:hypothetical protein